MALTPIVEVFNQLALSWGVEPKITQMVSHTDEMVAQVDRILIDSHRVAKGDNVIIVAGSPPGIPGSTNAMRVHRVGDAIEGIAPAYRK
jgi:pyruvate kinase